MDNVILSDLCKLELEKPIVAGVSGGPDSLCLLGMLHEAGFTVIVAHFNHQLRPEAQQEAEAVADRARALGLQCVNDRADVRAYAEEQSLSLEEAARILRYRFLFSVARQTAAQAVAVGHTADDQVETILMHFLRGAGLSGLKGMEYRMLLPAFDPQIPLVRPLLSLWREDTESYCQAHHLEPHFDASNTDQAFFRNRLRHALIPELEKYNPRFKACILRTAQALQGDHAVLQEVMEAAWDGVFAEKGEGWVAFDQPGLAALPSGSRRNLIRRAAESLRSDSRDFGFDALERAASFIETPLGSQMDFVNGLLLFHEEGKIYLTADEADLPISQWPQVRQPAELGDRPLDLGNGWILLNEETNLREESWDKDTDNWSAWLDADRLPGNKLVIRPRLPGDRFHPLGMHGQTVKVQELFINLKIPRRARLQWPLVSANEQICWVVGYRIAEPFRITEKTTRMIHLQIKKLPQT
jgi:tRNA(Ile)-lysidine synthase